MNTNISKCSVWSIVTAGSICFGHQTHAAIVDLSSSIVLAQYHSEGLYDMVGLSTWNGQPVSNTNQPNLIQRRLAADYTIYADTRQSRTIWVAITNVVTTQNSSWWGSPVHDVSLSGFGLQLATYDSTAANVTSLSTNDALAGQELLTGDGASPIYSTPGYTHSSLGSTSWIQCSSGTDYALVSFDWVTNAIRIRGSGLFKLELDVASDSIDWSNSSVTSRYGVDHQFVEALPVPAPGSVVVGLASLICTSFQRRRTATS
jgi:hypothetical protein